MSVKNFSNTVDLEKMGINKMKNDISDLVTVVGDEDSGLVKDVSDLKTTVGDQDSGLVANVARNTERIVDLETTVGGVSSGLVKKVNDLEYAAEHMHGIYHQSYTTSADPITITITFTEHIGVDTLFDIYASTYGIAPTSFSVSGQVATIVIPAQAADGVITLAITNPEMPI